MLGVRTFAEGVARDMAGYLSPELGNVECMVTEQQKNNGVKRVGILFQTSDERISPVVYMEPYYQAVKEGDSLEDVMGHIVFTAKHAIKTELPMIPEQMGNYEFVKKHLFPVLLNTKLNRELLKVTPHRQIDDLSLTAVLRFPMEDKLTKGSIKVTSEMLSRWDVNGEQVLSDAMDNLLQMDSPKLTGLGNTLGILMSGRDESKNLLSVERKSEDFYEDMAYVLSSESQNHGAAVMASTELMDRISELFPEGFYILPSSLHEVLIMPKDGQSPKMLGEMVREVNKEAVDRRDFLSDHVYEYNKELGKVVTVPESVEKTRGGMER